jgi:DNA-binding transcriptional ArsR family regulator
MWYISSDMITIFEVLTDPTRRRILDLLRMQPRLVGELVEILNMSQPAISKHLRVLREVGLVSVRQDAQRRWYELRPEPLMELDGWLKSYRYLWTERFERLDDYLQDLQKQEPEPEQGQE